MTDGDRAEYEDTIRVRCPHCGDEFETHAVGDIAGCEECGQTFQRFTNIVEADP